MEKDNYRDEEKRVDDIVFNSCEIYKNKEISSCIDEGGRILLVNVKLKNVICGSKIALGVIIYKNDYIKGLRTREITVGHYKNSEGYVDVNAGKFTFILAEDNLYNKTNYKIKIIYNYIS